MREPKPHLNLSVKASQEEGLNAIDKVQDLNLSAIAEKSEKVESTKQQKVSQGNMAPPKKQKKTINQLEKRLIKTNQILNGAKTRPSTVCLPKPMSFDGHAMQIYTDSEFESEEDDDDDESEAEDQESSRGNCDGDKSQDNQKKDARVASILKRGMNSS